MNNQEAKRLLRKSLERYRTRSYAALQSMLGDIETFQINGETGVQYQVEIQAFWDDNLKQNIRISGAIDDGGWRAFSPITDSFIVAPDGSFVGE